MTAAADGVAVVAVLRCCSCSRIFHNLVQQTCFPEKNVY